MGRFGGGIRYFIRPQYGVRMDVRADVSPNSLSAFLNATPVSQDNVLIGTEVGGARNGQADITDVSGCKLPCGTLGGLPISRFQTFRGTGNQIQATVTAGVFWKF